MTRIKLWWKRVVREHIIADDPHAPQLSRLDRLDGVK